MRILVTGAAGFLGTHLRERLIAEGHDVVGLDNFSTGAATDSVYFGSVVDPPFRITSDRFERVYHLASPASPKAYQADPLGTLRTNGEGTLRMLQLAREMHARFLLASTSEIYGSPPPAHHPQVESYWGHVNPIGYRSCYDEGKRYAEACTFVHRTEFGVDARIARIFNTYGPGLLPADGRVVSNFVVQGLKKEPLTIYGNGQQTRSLCYVDDLIDGLIRLMEMREDATFGEFPVVNLGNPHEISINALATKVMKLTYATEVFYSPLPVDDPPRRQPNIGRAMGWLNWHPRTSLDEGLKRTVEWFRARSGKSKG